MRSEGVRMSRSCGSLCDWAEMKDLGHSLRQTGAATKAAHVTRTACNTANCRLSRAKHCSLKIGTAAGGSRRPEDSSGRQVFVPRSQILYKCEVKPCKVFSLLSSRQGPTGDLEAIHAEAHRTNRGDLASERGSRCTDSRQEAAHWETTIRHLGSALCLRP